VVKFSDLHNGRIYPPGNNLFLLEAELTPRDIVRPEELCQWKIPMTPSGIEPATSRFVAQCPSIPMYPTQYLKKCIENFGGYKVAHEFPTECYFMYILQNVFWIIPISLVILLNAEHCMVCSNENKASKNRGFWYVVLLEFFAFSYNKISIGTSFTRRIS
jgi:hypothetical protein